MIKSGLKVVKSDSKKEQELKEKNKSLEYMVQSHQEKQRWHYKLLQKLKKPAEFALL